MLCASHSATAIRVTMDDDEAEAPEFLSSLLSSSSSNAPTNPSSSSSGFGRAIDRHNPIIRDGRRIGTRANDTSLLIPTPSSTRASSSSSSTAAPNTTATTHKTNHTMNTKIVTGASEFSELLANNSKKKKKKKNWQNTDTINTITSVHSGGNSSSSGGGGGGGGAVINKKKQNSSLGGGWGCKNPGDFISPPSFSSSRYLLSSHDDAVVLSDDPVIASEPVMAASKSSLQIREAHFDKLDEHRFLPPLAPASFIPVKPPRPPSPPPSDPSQHQQVVVLKVSLHCRGCERKMRKHISRMEGVTSFDIDFAAKKVMVVGDVTPLAVLASVSKVKNAQLLNPTISSSTPTTVAKASNYSETVKRQGIVV